jgi:hypothetical protein
MNQTQYNKLLEIALKICKNDQRTQDLVHDVMIQLFQNEKYNSLPEKEKLYFFVKTITNQYYSKSSKFYRTYKRMNVIEFDSQIDIEEYEYVDSPDIEWIKEELEKEKQINPDFWYNAGLFLLYVENKKIETLYKKTRIPKYSIRKTINEVKQFLKDKWEDNGKIR